MQRTRTDGVVFPSLHHRVVLISHFRYALVVGNEKGCDLWLVLTSFTDDEGAHRRELALNWGRKELKWVAEEFERAYGEELQLERSRIEKMESRWEADARGGRVTWLQKNAAWSRKQVAPAIRRVILGETQGDVSSKV